MPSHMIKHVKPKCMFFIRNDIWPNYIQAAHSHNVPVFLTIFALNAQSTFLKFPVRSFYRKIFQKFTAVFVQDAASEKVLKRNGYSENVIVTGNARIDRVIQIAKEEFSNGTIEKFVAGGFCFVAGSTHVEDRELFIETFQELLSEDIKWIIVPHEIDLREKEAARNLLGEKVVFYTEKDELNENTRLLWIDHIGMLAQLYRYTDVVYNWRRF